MRGERKEKEGRKREGREKKRHWWSQVQLIYFGGVPGYGKVGGKNKRKTRVHKDVMK
jgi:hypothetical protein